MADDDQDSKTEEPTGKRVDEARQQGNVPTSQELKTWVMLVGGTIITLYIAPWIASRLRVSLARFIEQPHLMSVDIGMVQSILLDAALEVGFLMLMPMGLLIVLAVGTALLQNGWMWTVSAITPKWQTISPVAGFKRQFSMRQMLELVKGIIKLLVVGAVSIYVVWPRRNDVESLMTMEVSGQMSYLMDVLSTLLITILVVIFFMAVADLVYQRWDYTQKLKMTKQEVKDEHKQQEGDPHVKGRIRSLRVQRSRERMMKAVPTADVVVTNPTHYAVALKYDMATMHAPVVVAKGVDFLALRIRELAEEHGVTIVENPPLARALYAAIDIDREIHPEHYKAVAEVIGYVMRLKGKRPH